MNLQRLIPLAFAVFVATSTSAVAQALTADEKELATYQLTMPTVRKVAAVMQRLNDIESKNPKVLELTRIRAEIDALEQKDELGKPTSSASRSCASVKRLSTKKSTA